MTNITIGQYIPGNSFIYKIDPRLKIILTIVWIVLLFLIPLNIYALLGFSAVFLFVVIISRIPLLKMLKGLKPVLFVMTFTFVLQLTYASPSETNPMELMYSFKFYFGLYQLITIIILVGLGFAFSKFVNFKFLYWLIIFCLCFLCQYSQCLDKLNISAYYTNMNWVHYDFNIYDVALIKAFAIVIRIILMISITSLLTFTTRYQEINQGFAAILKPLKIFHVPVGTFSMMLSLSLRFIPTLVEETNKIMKAQASRGVDFAESNLKQKVKQIVSLLVPLFIISFKKADDLANAMEARGYIMEGKRTSVDKLYFKPIDLVASIFTILLLVGVIIVKIKL